MTVRYYIVPMKTVSKGTIPSYVTEGGVAAGFTSIAIGSEPFALARANTTTLEDTAIVAHLDAFAIAPLDDLVASLKLITTQNAIEAAGIPGDWITVANTSREIVRAIAWQAIALQRVMASRLFTGGVTLATTVVSLPQATQDGLVAAINSTGPRATAVSVGLTLRQLFNDAIADWRYRFTPIEN
jgi:hypothetical protein